MTISTTRRAILAGAAALPISTLPTIAAVGDIAPQQDRELFNLMRDLKAAHCRMKQAGEVVSKAEEKYAASDHEPYIASQLPSALLEMFNSMTVGQIAALDENHPINAWYRQEEQRRVACLDEYHRNKDETGLSVAEAAWEKTLDELSLIEHRILATRARTIAGMQIKLRAVELCETPDNNLGEAWSSLSRDILALADQGGAKAVQS